MDTAKKSMTERTIEKLNVKKGDLILLKGAWDEEMIMQFGEHMGTLGVKALVVCLPDTGMDLSTMGIGDFYNLMKECEKKLGLDAPISCEDEGVCGD